jgi:hypothetical protein
MLILPLGLYLHESRNLLSRVVSPGPSLGPHIREMPPKGGNHDQDLMEYSQTWETILRLSRENNHMLKKKVKEEQNATKRIQDKLESLI